jgi:hypothetical protein
MGRSVRSATLVPAGIVALVVALVPAQLMAQTATMTVTSTSATVHKTPSMGSPVIGQLPVGRAVEVQRELGSWVAVSWGTGAGNSGYIHVSKGRVVHGLAGDTSYVAAAVAATAAAFTSISEADGGARLSSR